MVGFDDLEHLHGVVFYDRCNYTWIDFTFSSSQSLLSQKLLFIILLPLVLCLCLPHTLRLPSITNPQIIHLQEDLISYSPQNGK